VKKLIIALVIALIATGSASAADMPLKAPAAPAASTVPESAFFLGLGGSYNSTDFGTQDVYAVGTSSVFLNGALFSTGSAAGPGTVQMGTETKFAPTVQGGYFRKFSGSDWLWGFKFTYSDLASSSTVGNVLLPQAGSNTTVAGVTTPFTGTAVARTYQTTIDHQITFIPFIGDSFEKGFVYLGAGPTLSHTRTNVNGLVGFANVIGIPTDISGAPVDFTGSGWVYGGAAMVGATYFLSPSWFLDFSYSYAMTARQTFNYSSAFINPNGVMNTTIVGTLVGNSSGRVITQGITASINKAF
jgi:opacity protein-like surface antigen